MGELILKQFQRTRPTLTKALEGISAEAAAIIPEGFNNNIHWQVGHILVTGELFLFTGQQNIPAEYTALFGNSTNPADWPADVPSLETLIAHLDEQATRIEKIDVTTFDTALEKPLIGNNTVGEMASMGAFHEAMHVGQIQTLRRLIDATVNVG